MAITTTRLNNEDYSYFQDNFEVIDSNVSSLDDANTILLGECHTSQIDRIKNCWLLNKITSENDSIYVEGFAEGYFEDSYTYPIYKKVKLKSWDCQESIKKFVLEMDKLCDTKN